MEKKVFNVASVVRDTTGFIRRTAGERHRSRHVIESGRARVETDPSGLSQAIISLCILDADFLHLGMPQ